MAMQNALRIAVAALAVCGCHERLMPSAANDDAPAHGSFAGEPAQNEVATDDSKRSSDGGAGARRQSARRLRGAKLQIDDTDTCKNGGPSCSLEGAEELRLPSDSRTAYVDYSRSRQFHFYKATFKEKGKLTI